MTETPNLGLYTTDINEASEAGMSLFKILELLLGAGYITKSNMEKVDEGFGILKEKLSNYTSENVYITDHQKEGIENKQSEFNWNKNSQVEYIAKLLGGHEKCILSVENTNITSDKSDILFSVTQGFSKLNNIATSGISEIQLAKSLLTERIVLDIKNDNESIVSLTVYITVNGVQTTIPMTVPAKASVQKSFYNSIVRDLNGNSTIKFQAQTDGLPLIINSGSKAQYDYIDIDKINSFGDNFSDIIDNVYNELKTNIDSNSISLQNQVTDIENRSFGTNSVSIYVNDSTGNDGNDGTSAFPVKTISKAVSLAYRYNGHQEVSIEIASGIYNENVEIKNFHSPIRLLGMGVNNTFINGRIRVYYGGYVYVRTLTINVQNVGDTAISLDNCRIGDLQTININYPAGATGTAIRANGSKIILSSCTITKAKTCFVSQAGGDIFAQAVTGTDCYNVVSMYTGSKFVMHSSNFTNLTGYSGWIETGSILMINTKIDIRTSNITN